MFILCTKQIICTIFDVLSHFMLFCCKISLLCDLRCFVAKSVLSQFTRFGVAKNWATNFTCGEKRTNMKYVVIFAFMDLPIYVQHLLLDVAFQYPASMPHITTLSSHSHYASTFSRPAFQVVSVCHTWLYWCDSDWSDVTDSRNLN